MGSKRQVRNVPDGLLSQILGAALAAPLAIGFTTLGAVVTASQWLLTALADRLPELPTRPRHNAARVREQLLAARRVAEASGVLWSKVPDRTGRNS